MSTKIYNAYKIINPKKAYEVLHDIRIKAQNNFKQLLIQEYEQIMLIIDTYTNEEYNKNIRDSEINIRLEIASKLIKDNYKKATLSYYKNLYDLDVSIGINFYKGNYYLRAFADRISCVGTCLNFLNNHKDLTDYHYQNSTDKPKEIPKKEWNERGKIWEAIDTKDTLVLIINDYDSFYMQDVYMDIKIKNEKNPYSFPIYEEVLAEKLRTKFPALKNIVSSPGLIYGPGLKISLVKGKWNVILNNNHIQYDTLYDAYDYVYFEHLPEDMKNMILRYMERNAKSN